MTTPGTTFGLNLNAYAVVFFGDDDVPMVCRGMANGVTIDGHNYAIYEHYEDAAEEFNRWPHGLYHYGIIPARMVAEAVPARYVLKESAKKG